MDLVSTMVACLVGSTAGCILGSVAHARYQLWLRQRDAARSRARAEDLQRRAVALRDEKRAAGETGMVIIDPVANEIEWIPAPVSIVGPEGRA